MRPADDVVKLIDLAASFEAPDVFNPWGDVDPLDVPYSYRGRRTRLFQHFMCPSAQFLLVGEAPGYQGCHFSGIPFTNERLILRGEIPRVTGRDRFTTRELPWSEPAATVMWGVLHQLGIAERTVMWNAFAWHPHRPGKLLSNRTPTKAELYAGCGMLQAVTQHFQGVCVVAVGRVAERVLGRLGITPHHVVRHPSMGGARDFREQMSFISRTDQLALGEA